MNQQAGNNRGQPPIACRNRLSVAPNGDVPYERKTPYRDGTTHLIFEPLDFIAKLAALVPPRRANLARFHVAPSSRYRDRVVP